MESSEKLMLTHVVWSPAYYIFVVVGISGDISPRSKEEKLDFMLMMHLD